MVINVKNYMTHCLGTVSVSGRLVTLSDRKQTTVNKCRLAARIAEVKSQGIVLAI